MSEEELLLSTAMPLVFSFQKSRLLPVSIKMNEEYSHNCLHESRQLAHVFANFSHEMAILSHNSFQVCIE